MKKFFTFIFLSVLAFSASATIVNVNVANNTYTPAQVTIDLGDTVRFHWIEGNHPTASDNGAFPTFQMSSSSTMFDLKLTSAGVFDYHCTAHAGMTGSITVNTVASAPVAFKKTEVSVYPNPANQQVTVTHNFNNIDGVRITNMIGQQVRFVKPQFGSANRIEINIADLPKGIYLVNLQSRGNTIFTQRVVKDR